MLRQVNGNRMAAAKLLGISRRALYRRLERHQITDDAAEPFDALGLTWIVCSLRRPIRPPATKPRRAHAHGSSSGIASCSKARWSASTSPRPTAPARVQRRVRAAAAVRVDRRGGRHEHERGLRRPGGARAPSSRRCAKPAASRTTARRCGGATAAASTSSRRWSARSTAAGALTELRGFVLDVTASVEAIARRSAARQPVPRGLLRCGRRDADSRRCRRDPRSQPRGRRAVRDADGVARGRRLDSLLVGDGERLIAAWRELLALGEAQARAPRRLAPPGRRDWSSAATARACRRIGICASPAISPSAA